ncbi:hypothetical protein AHAS_Ahas13G0309500 [Arachis hypogaea]
MRSKARRREAPTTHDEEWIAVMVAGWRLLFVGVGGRMEEENRVKDGSEGQPDRPSDQFPINLIELAGFTDSSSSSLENEFMIQFATIPTAADHKGSGVKLAWLRTLKRCMQLDTALGRQIWISWCSQFHGYKKWTISHIRQLTDDISADGFVWNPYSHERMGNIVVPNEILQHRLTWSATVLLISFECIE